MAWSDYIVVVDIFLRPFYFKSFFVTHQTCSKFVFLKNCNIWEICFDFRKIDPRTIENQLYYPKIDTKTQDRFSICCIFAQQHQKLRVETHLFTQGSVFFWRFECLQYKWKQIWRIKNKVSGQSLNLNFEEVWWQTWKQQDKNCLYKCYLVSATQTSPKNKSSNIKHPLTVCLYFENFEITSEKKNGHYFYS